MKIALPALAALALLTLFHLARPVFGTVATVLLCVSVLLHPIFSTQVGYLYMEVPLFLFAVLALLAWIERRFWAAVLWAALARAKVAGTMPQTNTPSISSSGAST